MSILKATSLKDASYTLTVARHDPAHCLAPGLFRCYAPNDYVKCLRDGKPLYERYVRREGEEEGRLKLKDGQPIPVRRRQGYVVEYTYGSHLLKFYVAEGLGADDMRVLQGLVAMAGATTARIMLSSEPLTPQGRVLREALKVDFITDETAIAHSDAQCVVVRDSFYRLAKEIGYKDPGGGSTVRQIRECIERLYQVSVVVSNEQEGYSEGFRLLSRYKMTKQEDERHNGSHSLLVALNPRLATAILSGVKGGYTRIDLTEVRRIRSDGTRLIHQRLCGWINPGSAHEVSLATLCAYVWPEAVDESSSTHRTRVAAVRKYLKELVVVGWSVDPYRKGHVRVGRPSVPRTGAQAMAVQTG